MTGLNNNLRDTIINEAVRVSFEKKREAMSVEEDQMAKRLYNYVFSEKERKAVASVPDKWFRQDSCLKFNVNGMQLRFTVKKALPVPHTHSCNLLGSISGHDDLELAEGAELFAKAKEVFGNDIERARRELKAILYSVRTFKALEKAWPEGKPFYDRYNVADAYKGGLPAVQVESVNKLLGLASIPTK